MGLIQSGAAFLRDFYKNITKDLSWATTATNSAGDGFIAGASGHTLYIQKVVILVETSAAQSMTVASSTGSVTVANLASGAATGSHVFDWGEEGKALPEGADLDITVSAAGIGAEIHVEGYRKQTSAQSADALKTL